MSESIREMADRLKAETEAIERASTYKKYYDEGFKNGCEYGWLKGRIEFAKTICKEWSCDECGFCVCDDEGLGIACKLQDMAREKENENENSKA